MADLSDDQIKDLGLPDIERLCYEVFEINEKSAIEFARAAIAADRALNAPQAAPAVQPSADSLRHAVQPRLTVRLASFPESNGRRNWTALLVRTDKSWGGLIGNCGGITVARGELWNRVAYEAERAKFLIGERDDEPWILDYSDDIETPDNWPGEKGQPSRSRTRTGDPA